MSSELQEKAMDFMTKLYTIASEDPAVQQATVGKALILEFRTKDMPDFAMQLEVANDKQTVHRGAPLEPTVVVEYRDWETLRAYWAAEVGGLMLIVSGRIKVTRGSQRKLLFLGAMEKALRKTFQEIKDEFPTG